MWIKNSWWWIFIFNVLFNGVAGGQKDDNNAFLEIHEIGTIAVPRDGAFWFANGEVVLFGGGKNGPGEMASSGKSPADWPAQIAIFQNNNGDSLPMPQYVDWPFGPLGFGASAPVSDGVFCIGGLSPNGKSGLAFKINWQPEKNEVKTDTLPSLPVPLSHAGAVFFQNKIYVAGGVARDDDINKNLFILDINELGNGWQTVETPIVEKIISPSLVVQSDGVDDCLFIAGGVGEGCLQNGLYKFNIKTNKWLLCNVVLNAAPGNTSIQKASATAIGNASLLLFQQKNINSKIQDQAAMDVAEVGVYNTITNTYTRLKNPSGFKADQIIGVQGGGAMTIAKKDAGKCSVYKLQLIENASGFGVINMAVLILYFSIMIGVGIYFSRQQKTANDYFKGGQKIPFWAAGLSLIGTGLSAISFMAVPAKAFAADWAYYMLRLSLLFVTIIIGFMYIPVFRKLDITTAYEYLQKRFNLATRLIGSFSFIVFQLGRIGIVLFLPAVAINVVTGFDVVICIIVVGMVSLVYTVMGGIEAVIWTDVLQVIVLYSGIVLCVAFISLEINDGVPEIISIGRENNKFNIFNLSFHLQEPNFWTVVFGSFFINLTTYGADQTMVQRYLTTRTAKDATKSIWITVIVGFALGWLFFFMGTSLFAYYKTHPEDMLHTMSSNDAIFPWYIISQLPQGVSGLLIAAIFAAAMSSLSSSMNSAATAYTIDFHRLFKNEFNEVAVGRVVTLIIGLGGILVAILFATLNVKSIWDEFLKIIGLMTGGLGGVFLLGIVTEKANGVGVLIGLGVSAVVQYFVSIYQPFNLLLFTASGFISCFIFGYLFSWLLPAYNKSIKGLTIYSVRKND